ncbi:fasciclin domain-containing protein [Balneolaceae bacterium YR4-1]|uniref:Fasciclin domain-containing protein n=1 Tax=Halalkalibaculum roseum TaxID=2709311 RepID=A0A6M1SNW2_9BACT|nr:fasciclin domain-containing protein [Halalkalibaculum roseum]NGP76759.1 fasciclin domain-containing protein [Halalkalibaculum roseum]
MDSVNDTFKKFGLKTMLMLSAFIVFGLTGCVDDDDNVNAPPTSLNIVTLAETNDQLSILASAIFDADLGGTLQGTGPFTVFAPNNTAFNNLPDGTLDNLSSEQLAQILSFHVVEGEITASDLSASQTVETIQGEELLVTVDGGTVTVNGSAVVGTPDVEASNGIIHIIDEVLLPQEFREPNIIDQAEELGNFTTLTSAIEQTGLTSTLQYLGPFTVFAPTDAAFNNLPAGLLNGLSDEELAEILQYHVLNGTVLSTDLMAEQAVPSLTQEELFITANGGVTVNGSSSVATADVEVSNGVIHAVDQVLLPDAYGTIVDAASKRYFFSTLVSAVADAGLVDALSSTDANLTVFAPTDEAFANLPDGLLGSLTNEQLSSILQYHVLGSEVFAGDLSSEQSPESLTGEDLFITAGSEGAFVNGSTEIITTDVDVNNGVIHAIDGVLLPNVFLDIVQIAQKDYNLTSLVTALSDAGLVNTLKGDGPFTVFAPTNQAFEDASAVIESLSAQQVEDVLLYHAAAVEALSGDLSDGQTIQTVQGEDITVSIDGQGNVTLNGSVNVIEVDRQGTNGVVHVIDGVLVPPSFN